MIKTVYRATEVVNEYGTRGKTLGYFTNINDANVVVKDKGWYGGDGDVQEQQVIVVDGKVYLLEDAAPIILDRDLDKYRQDLKEAALKKLSIEERHVLGLK